MAEQFKLGQGPDEARMSIVTYDSRVQTTIQLDQYSDEGPFLAAVDRLPFTGGGTRTGMAMFAADAQLSVSKGMRNDAANAPKVVIVITDGKSADDTLAASKQLQGRGAIVFAVGIGSDRNFIKSMEKVVSTPYSKHIFQINGFSALAAALNGVVDGVCVQVEAAAPSPPLAPATVQTCTNPVDLVFVLDESISVAVRQQLPAPPPSSAHARLTRCPPR